MAKAVFTSKVGSGYDDVVEERYHFPRRYLRTVEQALGDLIVYYEPKRGNGDMAYFAMAQVVNVRPDPSDSELFYADLRGYLDFARKVPFAEGGKYYETQLQKADGSTSRGAFGWAVRPLPEGEFQAILTAGLLAPTLWPDVSLDASVQLGFAEPAQEPFGGDRPLIALTRPFRDRIFSRVVQRAYDRRCAVTGLRLLNGGGRPEVQAAHIQPVASSGPDSVRNGIALSGTIHWLFDRGLMTFDDDYSIRMVESAIPEQVRGLIDSNRQLILPAATDARPSPYFLRHHRENVFKG
jgi:putative restriction endonuclease